MEAARLFQTLGPVYQTTPPHILQNITFHTHRRNLNSRSSCVVSE